MIALLKPAGDNEIKEEGSAEDRQSSMHALSGRDDYGIMDKKLRQADLTIGNKSTASLPKQLKDPLEAKKLSNLRGSERILKI